MMKATNPVALNDTTFLLSRKDYIESGIFLLYTPML